MYIAAFTDVKLLGNMSPSKSRGRRAAASLQGASIGKYWPVADCRVWSVRVEKRMLVRWQHRAVRVASDRMASVVAARARLATPGTTDTALNCSGPY